MNNTSTVAELVRKAGKWAVLGSVITIFSIAAASCLKEEETAPDNDDDAAAGNGNDDDGGAGDNAGGAGGADEGETGASFMDACSEEMGEETLLALQECGSSNEEAQQLKVNMLVVLDKSGSMDNVPDGYNTSLWESVKSALQAVLEDSKDRINYAMELYPFPEDPEEPISLRCEGANCCEMPSGSDINVGFDEEIKARTGDAPDDPAYKRIQQALDDTSPGGGTPTAEALRRAREYLQSAGLDGNTYVLLATDGGPNCNENAECDRANCTMHIDGACVDEPDEDINCCAGEESRRGCVDDSETREAIENLADDGVKTYVVGIPGSEPYEPYLNQFAIAGGVPAAPEDDAEATKYYRVSESGGANELVATFKKITEQLVTSCEIPLAVAPPDPQRVNVAVNCLVLADKDADGNAQWELSDNNTVINILGDDCEHIQENGARRVDVLLGCPPLGIY